MKKYNRSTGCYKINIYVNGKYACSTDWSKTCKEAVKGYIKHYPEAKNVKACFDRT